MEIDAKRERVRKIEQALRDLNTLYPVELREPRQPLSAAVAKASSSGGQSAGVDAARTPMTAAALTGAAVVWHANSASDMSVARIWRRHALRPHRLRHFRASNDPAFEAKAPPSLDSILVPASQYRF